MTPRSPKYDAAAHAERVRDLLAKRIAKLPLPALVKLQEVAALLEAGERLEVLLTRERHGKRRGNLQVQQRENLDRALRDEATAHLAHRLAEEAADAAPSRFAWHRHRRPGTPPDPLKEAGRIVREATEVDWSREPGTEYEAELRAAFLARHLERGSLGWMELMALAANHGAAVGADLRAAADDAEQRLNARVAERQRQEMDETRAALEREDDR
jgi:hypothetical protein